jgi:hypothetical protein
VNKPAFGKLPITWANLTEREKLITAALGVVLCVSMISFPIILLISTNTSIEEESEQLRKLGEKIASQREKFTQMTQEKRMTERRYQQKAPALGGFLESLAHEQDLTIREVTDQPEKNIGVFRRRNVRIFINSAPLSPLINLMSAIETSRYPLAIEYIQLEHYQLGDNYQLKLGVVTYDKEGARPAGTSVGEDNKPAPEPLEEAK